MDNRKHKTLFEHPINPESMRRIIEVESERSRTTLLRLIGDWVNSEIKKQSSSMWKKIQSGKVKLESFYSHEWRAQCIRVTDRDTGTCIEKLIYDRYHASELESLEYELRAVLDAIDALENEILIKERIEG